MSLVHGTELFAAARKGHYAIGAFNTNNLEWTRAILGAAQELNVPVLIQTSMGAAKYMGGYELCQQLVEATIKSMNITVPVVMHLDHGNYEAAKAAIAAGYNSVMFDGHDLPFAENLEKTKEIVALAHAKGISVEAEVGSIGGEEDGIVGEGELAPIDDAVAMAKLGVDFLAAGIGNIHGPYPENWKGLHIDHLEKLNKALVEAMGHNVPIVLHGGSGIPDDQIREAIANGVAKVNVNTECQLAFAAATRKFVNEFDANEAEYMKKKLFDPRKFLKPGFDAITASVEERIDVFGSANKA